MAGSDGSSSPRDEPYGSDWFWRLVAEVGADRSKMRRIAEVLSEPELERFHTEFVEVSSSLQGSPFVELLAGLQSEDGVEDVSHFVVAQGREYFFTILNDPARLPRGVPSCSPALYVSVLREVHYDRFRKLFKVY